MKASTLLALTAATFALAAPTPETNEDVSKRQYASYGTYPPPPGGYASYGSYPGQYSNYGSYGTYTKRAVDWVKSFFV